MYSEELCLQCREIRFELLLHPTQQELDKLMRGESTLLVDRSRHSPTARPLVATDDWSLKAVLGTLSAIRERSSSCPLCKLFVHVVSRQQDGPSKINLDRDDYVFMADPVPYYLWVIDLERMEKLFLSRRLCLYAVEDGPDPRRNDLIAYFDHCFQPCNLLGVESVSSNEPNSDNSHMVFAGRKRDLQIDFNMIKNWLNVCTNNHIKACNIKSQDATVRIIRFIETSTKLIRQFEDTELHSIRYATLSYVWGITGRKLVLTLANRSSLMEDGISQLEIPRTIEDAIIVAQMLDIEYLWVDALCITQDDLEDKKIQIGNMALIYSCALMNIVAATGKDSDAGLPGLYPNTRFYEPQTVEVMAASDQLPGLALQTAIKSYPSHWSRSYELGLEDVDTGSWSTRAWTMQERAVSCRNLLFTDEQVTWSCREASFCEESHFEEVPTLQIQPFLKGVNSLDVHQISVSMTYGLDRASNPDSYLNHFMSLVRSYTKRNMTNDGDMLDAFSAIISQFEPLTGTSFLWGIPRSHFELGLCWETGSGQMRRETLTTLPIPPLNRRMHFPSWSWMGWIGPALVSVTDERRLNEIPQISCYLHHTQPLRFISIADSNSPNGETLSSVDEGTEESMKTDVEEHLPLLTESCLRTIPDESVVFFWAETAFFTVPRPDDNHQASSINYTPPAPEIIDSHGKVVGEVGRMLRSHWDADYNYGKSEFVLMAKRIFPELEEARQQFPDIPDIPGKILVLQIRWEDGVAYRVNYGEILEEEWRAAEPMRKLIALA